MRQFQRTASPIVLDRDGIALSQTPGAAGPILLNGAGVVDGVAILSPPRPVAIYSGGNIAAIVFTITGRDRAGTIITETVTGVNTNTVSTVSVFASVISITVSASPGSAIEAGWTAVSYTSWIIVGNMRGDFTWQTRVFLPNGGTVNYDVEGTTENLLRNQRTGDRADDIASLAAAQTANYVSANTVPYTAIRLKVNSQDQPVVLRVTPSRTV